ncbi:MAG TPA: hypothetical protein VFH58_12260 [Acidimicrobiales bacterium]|nr:hypothetical protein [Acidimicrobiales bacterium]
MKKRYLSVAASAATLAGVVGGTLINIGGGTAAAAPNIQLKWSQWLNDGPSGVIAQSAPIVATLDGGGPAALVGDRGGHIYALHLSNGTEVAGWPASTGGYAVDAPPSNTGSSVFVGLGTPSSPSAGGNARFNSTGGGPVWIQHPQMVPGSGTAGVQTGMAIGNLQGQLDVVSGSMGQYSYALRSDTGGVLPGWPFLDADSNFATPAIADLYSTGANEVIEGGDSTGNPVVKDQLGIPYSNGGHIRVISTTGGLMCEYNSTEVIHSSPAVGQFLGSGQVGIVAGTGNFYTTSTEHNDLIGVNSHCQRMWETKLNGDTESSPAIVSALGGSALQVAEGTSNNGAGSVYLINGSNGSVIWQHAALGAILGGVASVDLGGGYQDIVATTTGGVQIFDGKTGNVVWQALNGTLAFQNAPLITHDPDGNVGITVAGYGPHNGGTWSAVYHYEVVGDSGSRATEAGSWPMFHHDPQLSGNAGTPPVRSASIRVPCSAPSTTPSGYWMAASDGGIFNYGNLPFCGSTGGITLARPIVGIAGTANAGGYWLVASDGGIFNFGNASFHGSTGGVPLVRPIVGMARTPSGNGYWLVASDGGVFSFGDAKFHGSTGGVRLAQPIVAITPTPDGGGYWLVASDGGIFAFGDARFHGSTGGVRLARPIVGMAATSDGGGYWMVASDGGIFAFGDARFHGSTGGVALAKPIVAMQATKDGGGYWLVASDGGVFSFGDAKFRGSTGGITLARPVVGLAGY